MAFLRNRTHHLLLILVGLGVVTVISSSVFNYMTRASASNSTFDNPNNQPIADVVIDKVFVDKSERRLQLLSGDDVIRTYHIALGDSPVGHKQQEGDQRTPVGIYTLDYKNENSIAHRSIHISYPNAADKARAKQLGVSPGGDIMIHGQMNGFGHLAAINQKYDWTDGCIAVTDDEMDEIMAAVTLGIPIEIVE
ncbi:L,D-transpeptidase family protein [Psychrobacter fozii]|uniref:L,D-transpeptidase-like protein n=1 Tax=Psychrobacter fozii TaxID=198480 RepID=A0A2V4VWQ6_9GAMM|nr:L,D-transpeptidase family protein [Psychrobacter fozii]PYE39774.1 L,D-transpeptidase-like protein [Psychrobacter fozii]